jgi:hypothetical protein
VFRIAVAVGLIAALSGCTPGTSVAYHVDDDVVDVAFCESFEASRVDVDFGKYPPPFMGSLYSIGMWTASGPLTKFGSGVPVSVSTSSWEWGEKEVPPDWERVDFTFYDADDEFAGATYYFASDVVSSDWGWTDGYNVSPPRCALRVD